MINELAAVLGTIGTVFGCYAVHRQFVLELSHKTELAEMQQEMAIHKERFKQAMDHFQDRITAIRLATDEHSQWIDAYERMTAQTAGEYRQQYDEKTQQTTYKHMDAIDPKEALVSAPGFRDKLEATKARLGYK